MNTRRLKTGSAVAAGVAFTMLLGSGNAAAQDSGAHHYARRGEVYRTLPREAVAIANRGGRYYYRGGEWYRPYGSRFVVIAPPLGAVVPFLPGVYTSLWFGGVPYYYANDAYYLWRPDLHGYLVTQPPADAGTAATAPPTAADVEPFVYPRNGQSEAQQATDRYECHHWAAGQSSFDPTNPPVDAGAKQTSTARADYTRALTACLEGRGYSVK